MEETTADIIKRLREKGIALGLGVSAKRARTAKIMATARPARRKFANESRLIRDLDTGETWENIGECVKALDGSINGLSTAIRKASAGLRGIKYKGRRLELVELAK